MTVTDLPDWPAFRESLLKAKTIAVLTGAGVSTESGIPDFNSIDDAWPFELDRAEVTDIAYFKRDPEAFWEAYRYLFAEKQELKLEPNKFHRALASLEEHHEVIILTQNVDGLHQAAGSSQVGELHGNAQWAFCSRGSCPYRVLMSELPESGAPRCPQCKKYLRPDTVLFGESPRLMGDAKGVCVQADLLIVAGTSLRVGPVNGLPQFRQIWFPERDSAWLNLGESPDGYYFNFSLRAPLGEIADALMEAHS